MLSKFSITLKSIFEQWRERHTCSWKFCPLQFGLIFRKEFYHLIFFFVNLWHSNFESWQWWRHFVKKKKHTPTFRKLIWRVTQPAIKRPPRTWVKYYMFFPLSTAFLACRKTISFLYAIKLGRSFEWYLENRSPVAQQVIRHDKDPSHLKCHRSWNCSDLFITVYVIYRLHHCAIETIFEDITVKEVLRHVQFLKDTRSLRNNVNR